MSKFKIIVNTIFVLCILAGVTAFALYKGADSASTLAAITVWGTFPSAIFNDHVARINNDLSQSISVKYVQIPASSFEQEFVSALARGTGPDAILVPVDILLPLEDKLALVPYSALSQRSFMDTYVSEAGVYVSSNGILALPFSIDPLVMYWNRDTFDGAGLATYPKYWDEFAGLTKKLTSKDANGNVRKSAVALGDFGNINNAREILGTFLLQLGNPVTKANQDGQIVSSLKISAQPSPASAIQFFTQFADPSNAGYSWNKAMPADKSAFLAGTLATYFGFASELRDIRDKNPNLNFDAAPLPQLRTGGQRATYAKMYGYSLVRTSQHLDSAYQIGSILTYPTNLSRLSNSMYLPSVRRDVISQGSNDPYIEIFNQAALIGATWLDVDPATSRGIMADMVGYVTSGQKSLNQAIQDAGEEYDTALRQAVQ